jgi:hypothetical protein
MSHRWSAVAATSHWAASAASYRAPDLAPAARLAPPPPGRAVLACRCGVMLDLDEMHRPDRGPDRAGTGVRIDPISCARCARESTTGL